MPFDALINATDASKSYSIEQIIESKFYYSHLIISYMFGMDTVFIKTKETSKISYLFFTNDIIEVSDPATYMQ